MGFMDKMQSGLEKVIGPVAEKVSTNRFIQAMMAGFMLTLPITLGTALIAILAGLPIDPWQDFITDAGLKAVADDTITLTLSMLGVYVVGAIGYTYTKNQGQSGMIGALIALASFMLLQPMKSELDPETFMTVNYITQGNMGADGIFVALLIGLFVPALYCWLMDKNITLKLPSSVPPMVSTSLSPTFVAMIVFTTVFAIKYGFTQTEFGDIFTFVSDVIAEPVTKFGATPQAVIGVIMVMNLFWFFGVHPQTVMVAYLPVLMLTGQLNLVAYQNGQELPYLLISVVWGAAYIGGAGNTLGLCVATLFAKSEKYKALRKVSIPTNIFNINEPIIFGFPVMLNPLYFIPMLLTPLISGLVAWFLAANVFTVALNPTISMPWVTPYFISSFMTGGLALLAIMTISVAIHFAIYLPFFLMDDANAKRAE